MIISCILPSLKVFHFAVSEIITLVPGVLPLLGATIKDNIMQESPLDVRQISVDENPQPALIGYLISLLSKVGIVTPMKANSGVSSHNKCGKSHPKPNQISKDGRNPLIVQLRTTSTAHHDDHLCIPACERGE